MMTEDEAKTKWCPFARVVPTTEAGGVIPEAAQSAGYNRGSAVLGPPLGTLCLASRCAAWRWVPSRPITADELAGHESPHRDAVRRGYCGLAGSPQP